MAQKAVEIVIGRLVTDEALRGQFRRQPATVLRALQAEGLELSAVEAAALEAVDLTALEQFACALDPRLQKAALAPAARAPRRKRRERARQSWGVDE